MEFCQLNHLTGLTQSICVQVRWGTWQPGNLPGKANITIIISNKSGGDHDHYQRHQERKRDLSPPSCWLSPSSVWANISVCALFKSMSREALITLNQKQRLWSHLQSQATSVRGLSSDVNLVLGAIICFLANKEWQVKLWESVFDEKYQWMMIGSWGSQRQSCGAGRQDLWAYKGDKASQWHLEKRSSF